MELNDRVKEYFTQVLKEYSEFQGWLPENEDVFEYASREGGLYKSAVLLSLSRKGVVVTMGDVLEMALNGVTEVLEHYCWGIYEVAPGFLTKEPDSYILASIYLDSELHFTVADWIEVLNSSQNPFAEVAEEGPPTEEVSTDEVDQESENLDSQETENEV